MLGRYGLLGFLDYLETMRPSHGELSYQLLSTLSSVNATAAVTGAERPHPSEKVEMAFYLITAIHQLRPK